jgi:hypothetical protein
MMLSTAQQHNFTTGQTCGLAWLIMSFVGLRHVLVLQGCVLEEYTQGVEEKLRALELESIQDYIAESDNLVDLHQQVGQTAAAGLNCIDKRR